MNRNLPDIEELFKSALENEEEMPEPKVWKAIDAVLDKDNIVSINKKYENLKKVAFLLFFMLIGLSIYELEKPSAKNYILQSEKNSGSNSKNESKSNSVNNTLAGTDSSIANEAKSLPNNSLVGTAQSDDSELRIAMSDEKKQGRVPQSTNFDRSFQPIIVNRSDAKFNNKIGELQKTEFVEEDMKSYNKDVLKDYGSLYAERTNQIKRETFNQITLPHSPALIKVISGIDNKSSSPASAKIKTSKISPLSLNLFFSPDFASYRIENDGTGNNNNEATDIVKHEHHEFSSTAGVLVDYKLKKHWSLQSGLTFSNINISVSPKTIYAKTDNTGSIKYRLNTSSGYGYVLPSFSNTPSVGDSLYSINSSHTLQYVGIPASLKYSFQRGRFSFNAMLGGAVNILTKAKIETEIENGFSNEMDVVDNMLGMKKWYFSGFAGVGFDYNISRKFGVTFEPTYRFAINSINKNTPVKSYPNSIGLATGIRMNF